MSFYQHGNGGNIASVGAGAGTEQSQYYGHNSGASIGQGTYAILPWKRRYSERLITACFLFLLYRSSISVYNR